MSSECIQTVSWHIFEAKASPTVNTLKVMALRILQIKKNAETTALRMIPFEVSL